MRLGLPLSGEFRKTRQKKYKEKHEQGRIAAAGLCLLRGENGACEGGDGNAEQQQLQQQGGQQQPDPAAPDADAVQLPADGFGQAAQEAPVLSSSRAACCTC